VRHPQYISLTLFGLGILLTWGRAMTFLAFFFMMFLYYYLAKSEERSCIRLFGEDYNRYREHTSFIFPGDIALRRLAARLPKLNLPAPVRVAGAFVATMAACFALMWLIQSVRLANRRVPYLTAAIPLGPADEGAQQLAIEAGAAGGVPFVKADRVVVARGPYRNAWAAGFAESVLTRLRDSETLKPFLAFLDAPDGDVLFVFCGPYDKPETPGQPGMHRGGGPSGRGPAPDPQGPHRVRLILMRCTLAAGATVEDALADKAKRAIKQGCVAQVNLARPKDEDFVEADGRTRGRGFPGEQRWGFFVKQFAALPSSARHPQAVAVPGKAETGTLILVQAPILRTRLDHAFAEALRDRLAASETMRAQLRTNGIGAGVVAVAFPRPGPNWYQAHHLKPQVSVFTMVVRLAKGATTDDLFTPGRRQLLSAFTAEMDFKIEPPQDSVSTITAIGAWRDLEERWDFFLSGVGGGGIHLHHHR